MRWRVIPRCSRSFVDEPRGFAETHANVFEPRIGASYSINAKTIVKREQRRLPQPRHRERLDVPGRQPAVSAAGQRGNGIADNPGGVGGGRLTAVRHDGHRSRVQAPDVVHVVGWGAAASAVQLHRRRDLRRPARPVHPARARYQSVAARDGPGEPWRQHRRPAPLHGLRRDPSVGERCRSKYHSLQISADRRYINCFKFGVAYTLGKSEDDASAATATSCSTTTMIRASGATRASIVATSFNFYYIYDVPF